MLSWRYPLDEIRKEIRKSRTDGNTSVSLDGVENLIDELASVCSEVDAKEKSESTEDDGLKEFFVAQREMITTSYEQGKQYANIIVLGGYAGLFAIWNFTKNDLAQWQTFTVGLSILLSLTTYIVFELYSSWLRSTQVFNQLRELEEVEKLNEIPAEYGKAELARAKRFIKLWPFFFFGAIGFALAAVLVLGYSFICGLL